jgi:hypothetical protein
MRESRGPHHPRLGRRDMLQPPLETVRRGPGQPRACRRPIGGLLLPRPLAKGDAVTVNGHQARVVAGTTPQGPRQLRDHSRPMPIPRHDPHLPPRLGRMAETGAEGAPLLGPYRRGQHQCPTRPRPADRGQPLAPQDRHDDPCGPETPVAHSHPLPRRGPPAPRDKTMQRRRQEQRLTPRLPRGTDAWWRAHILGGRQQGAQGVAHGLKQPGGQHGHVGQPQGMEVMGQGEENLVVSTGPQPGLLESEPTRGLEVRALRTRPVPTGIVPDARSVPLRTGLHMAAQRCGPPLHDGAGGFPDMTRQGGRACVVGICGLEEMLESHQTPPQPPGGMPPFP